MISNFIKLAFRNLRKNRLYTGVNLLGLTIGLTSCLLIGVYVLHEISYDKFHPRADQIVRATMEYKVQDVVGTVAVTGSKVGPEFARNFPEVEDFTRIIRYSMVVNIGDENFEEKNFVFADSGFFKMFNFNLLQGNPETVLNGPSKMVITRSAAMKYFGSLDVVGRNMKVGTWDDFTITGVAEDCPENSQIRFEMLGSFTTLSAAKNEQWWSANYITYFLLKNNSNIESFRRKADQFMSAITKELDMGSGNYLRYNLEPLTWIHLNSKLDGLEPNGNIVYVYVLGIVGLLILVIACVNYTNLANAQSAKRASEIGVRKVMGANRSSLFGQFMGESFLLTLLSMIFAIVLACLLLPYFNQLAGKSLQVGNLLQPSILWLAAGLLVVVSLLSGFYPALLLANLQVGKVLKTGFNFTAGAGGLRKSLIIFQFAISVFLIVSTAVILLQLAYINNKELGYNKEQVVVLPVDSRMQEGLQLLKEQVSIAPGVLQVAGAYEEPTNINWTDGITKGEGSGSDAVLIAAIPVDEHFVKTMGIEIIAGSDFSPADASRLDTSDGSKNYSYTFMLNESAVSKLGWTPEEAIGKVISKDTRGEVKAVVRDFHYKSMHNPIGPLLIFLEPNLVRKLFVRIEEKNVSATIAALENIWKQRVPHRPFQYHFLDEDFQALYEAEQKSAAVFSTFSALAILLACMGLFALTAFSVVQRTKEIGIRKVLGASLANLFALLTKDFLLLVIVALIIASPLAWIAGNKWLEQFSYRISIEWWVFAMATVITVGITILTISYQAIKAARTNPVTSLKTE